MVCPRNMSVDTLHKGDIEDNNNNNNHQDHHRHNNNQNTSYRFMLVRCKKYLVNEYLEMFVCKIICM
jgi:hypothetical protein